MIRIIAFVLALFAAFSPAQANRLMTNLQRAEVLSCDAHTAIVFQMEQTTAGDKLVPVNLLIHSFERATTRPFPAIPMRGWDLNAATSREARTLLGDPATRYIIGDYGLLLVSQEQCSLPLAALTAAFDLPAKR